MSSKVDLDGCYRKIDDITKGDRYGLFAASEAQRLMSKYTPMRTGALRDSYKVDPWRVRWKTPYAQRVYYANGLRIHKDVNPFATKLWDKTMANNDGKRLAQAFAAYIKRSAR